MLDGASPTALSADGGPIARRGFETPITVHGAGPYYEVEALGPSGQVLGTSNTQKAK